MNAGPGNRSGYGFAEVAVVPRRCLEVHKSAARWSSLTRSGDTGSAKPRSGAVIKQCPGWSGARVAVKNEDRSSRVTRDRLEFTL